MAAFIKRILKSKSGEEHSHWASREERERFERQREQWKENMSLYMIH